MNGKRLLILAAFAAFATVAMPAAYAVTVSNQANITVKWNTLAVGSMLLNSDYSAAGAQQNTIPTIVTTNNGGLGSCGGSAAAEANATVNFFNVAADGTKFTDCQYRNAAIATVTTSDPSGYTVTTQNVTGALPANYGICGFANGIANNAGNTAWVNNGGVFQDNTGAATSLTALPCPSVGVGTSAKQWDAGNTTAQTIFSNGGATTGTNLGADYILVIGPNAAVGAQSFNVQYTLTLN